MILRNLLSSDESVVDSIIVGSLIALLTLCGLTTYQTVMDPHAFSPANFGAGVVAVIGAAGGLKTARERWGSGERKPGV